MSDVKAARRVSGESDAALVIEPRSSVAVSVKLLSTVASITEPRAGQKRIGRNKDARGILRLRERQRAAERRVDIAFDGGLLAEQQRDRFADDKFDGRRGIDVDGMAVESQGRVLLAGRRRIKDTHLRAVAAHLIIRKTALGAGQGEPLAGVLVIAAVAQRAAEIIGDADRAADAGARPLDIRERERRRRHIGQRLGDYPAWLLMNPRLRPSGGEGILLCLSKRSTL